MSFRYISCQECLKYCAHPITWLVRTQSRISFYCTKQQRQTEIMYSFLTTGDICPIIRRCILIATPDHDTEKQKS